MTGWVASRPGGTRIAPSSGEGRDMAMGPCGRGPGWIGATGGLPSRLGGKPIALLSCGMRVVTTGSRGCRSEPAGCPGGGGRLTIKVLPS